MKKHTRTVLSTLLLFSMSFQSIPGKPQPTVLKIKSSYRLITNASKNEEAKTISFYLLRPKNGKAKLLVTVKKQIYDLIEFQFVAPERKSPVFETLGTIASSLPGVFEIDQNLIPPPSVDLKIVVHSFSKK